MERKKTVGEGIFARDVYGLHGHPGGNGTIARQREKASIAPLKQEAPKKQELTVTPLLKQWPLVHSLVTGPCTVEDLKKKFEDQDKRSLEAKLQQLKDKGICVQVLPDGKRVGVWSLTANAQTLAVGLLTGSI